MIDTEGLGLSPPTAGDPQTVVNHHFQEAAYLDVRHVPIPPMLTGDRPASRRHGRRRQREPFPDPAAVAPWEHDDAELPLFRQQEATP